RQQLRGPRPPQAAERDHLTQLAAASAAPAQPEVLAFDEVRAACRHRSPASHRLAVDRRSRRRNCQETPQRREGGSAPDVAPRSAVSATQKLPISSWLPSEVIAPNGLMPGARATICSYTDRPISSALFGTLISPTVVVGDDGTKNSAASRLS